MLFRSLTRSELENKIAVLLGGRIAEELIFGEASTGAADDLQKATNIAKRMVKDYGMSELLGTVALEKEPQPAFFPTRESAFGMEYSEETAREIDQEVRRFIDGQTTRVKDLLTQLKPVLLEAAQKLLAQEVMTGDDLRVLMDGGKKKTGLQIA